MPSLSFDNIYNINASRNEPVHSQEKSHLRLKWIKGRNVKVGQFCSELHQSWVHEKAKRWSSMTKDPNDTALPFQCFSGVSLQTCGSEPHVSPTHGFRQSLPLAQHSGKYSQYYFPVRNTGRHFHPKRKALKLFWNKASFTKFFKPAFFSQWKKEFNCILGDIATNFPYILKMPLKAPYIMTYLYFLCVKKNDVMYPTDSQSIR